MSAVVNLDGTESGWGKRHCPSAAMLAPKSSPSLSSRTVEKVGWNNTDGNENQKINENIIMLPTRIFLRRLQYESIFFNLLLNFKLFLQINKSGNDFVVDV